LQSAAAAVAAVSSIMDKLPSIGGDGDNDGSNNNRSAPPASSNADANNTDSLTFKNPFTLPTDEEVFHLRDEERRRRDDAREENGKKKIWQKGKTGPLTGRSLRLKELVGDDEGGGTNGLPNPPGSAADHRKKGSFKPSSNTGNNAVSAAAGAINERRQEKEIMTDFIAKKREMFLVQMSLDTKREEIRKLEEKAQMKEEALQKSEHMLAEDSVRFDTFLKENDRKAHESIKKAERETKLKTDKVQEIKKLNQLITQVQSDMSKHKEALEDCLKYKDFLDKLTPPEWFEDQRKAKRNRTNARRAAIAAVKKEAWKAEKVRLLAEAKKKAEVEAAAMSSSKKKRKTKIDKNGGTVAGGEVNFAADKVHIPREPLTDDEELVESDSEMPMYFKEPQQLLDVFTALEEQNLFLIQNSQETEQALEELKQNYRHTRKKLDDKTSSLEQNMEELNEQIHHEEYKAESLKVRVQQSTGDTQEKQEALLASLGEKVKDVYQRVGTNNTGSTPSTLVMLSELEAQLENLLSALEQMPPEYVKKAEKEKEKKRRDIKRNEQKASQEQAQIERNKKAIERSRQPPKKRTGRQIMFRSQPVRRKIKEDEKENTEDDMDELKHLT
jgi:hypothetical protein